MNDLVALHPEIILGLGAILLMLVAAWRGAAATRAVALGALVLLGTAAVAVIGASGLAGLAFNDLFVADAWSRLAKLLIYGATAVCILLAPRWFERQEPLAPEYVVLILFSTVGASVMVSANDMLTLYVGLELQSLASYVLAAMARRDRRSSEAALKYFVLGALASGVLLYGMTLIYGFAGTTQFAGIAAAYGATPGLGLIIGLVFVFAGLAFKLSAVPFHMWAPDVYEGAPTPVTMLFASAQKVAAIAIATRVALLAMGPAADMWRQIVVFAALASIILGAVAAIGQRNIKRLMAYSSINNVGFALLGLAVATAEGAAAVMTYMAIYIVMTLGAFAVILQMRDAEGRPVESLSSLAGLSRRNGGLAAALAIFMFALAGIPPLFGFWGKFVVFDALVGAGLWTLAAIGIAASVIGAFYYLRVIKIMYFDAPEDGVAYGRASRAETAIAGLAAAFMLGGWIIIPLLGAHTATAAQALIR